MKHLCTFGILAAAVFLALPAHAALVLTAAGTSAGFTLTSVVTGIPTNTYGPLGLAIAPDGNLVVNVIGEVGGSRNSVFADVDGQIYSNKLSTTGVINAFPPAYATSNGALWGSGGASGTNAGKLIKFNNDGTINTVFNITGLNIQYGLWTNPVNGHLIGEGAFGLVDVDVSTATPTFRQINNAGSDGVTVSPDGTVVYTSQIAGYNILTGALVFGPVSVSGADGMGVITSNNALNGNIIVNTNFGQLVMINPVTHVQTIIASGGTRGDYTSPDPNGSLLITQTSEIFRLSCGAGCAIGSAPPPSGVPEPSSVAFLGTGLAVFGLFRKRFLTR
ncbi:MAG: hypothetical protein JWO19_4285 [Bryobacterales bacterium]|jgi:hypothetical protein|nr:hypothetical protein [Bryobacterales bacterium]